jgi:hypothetical protein
MKFYEAMDQVDKGKRMRLPTWGKDYIQKQLDMVYKFSYITLKELDYDQKCFYQPLYLEIGSDEWIEAQ